MHEITYDMFSEVACYSYAIPSEHVGASSPNKHVFCMNHRKLLCLKKTRKFARKGKFNCFFLN